MSISLSCVWVGAGWAATWPCRGCSQAPRLFVCLCVCVFVRAPSPVRVLSMKVKIEWGAAEAILTGIKVGGFLAEAILTGIKVGGLIG